MTTAIFTEDEFWPAFAHDLRFARGRVLIQSPFLRATRVSMLSKHFRALISKGVVICLFVQEPRNWTDKRDTLDPETARSLDQWKSVIEMLEKLGTHVNVRKKIHAKLAVIDARFLWEGSLNILSHANTTEHMRRWECETEIRTVVKKNALTSCDQCTANHAKYGMGTAKGLPPLKVMGGLLKAFRAHLTLSQESLAKQCGLRQAKLSQIEGGKNITLKTFLDVTAGLRVEPILSPDWLVPSVMQLLNNAMNDDGHTSEPAIPRSRDNDKRPASCD